MSALLKTIKTTQCAEWENSQVQVFLRRVAMKMSAQIQRTFFNYLKNKTSLKIAHMLHYYRYIMHGSSLALNQD